MRAAGLSGYVKRRKHKTTVRVPGVRVAEDLVERDFNPVAPNRLWASDIKYVSTREGTLYLASVIDCFSRRVVGWAMRDEMSAELVVDGWRWRSFDGDQQASSFITPTRARSPSSTGRRNTAS